MTEAALQSTSVRAMDAGRAGALRRFALGDSIFRGATYGAALAVLLLLGGVIVALVIGALPALQTFGLDFLTT
ncbi:MAG TPA: phosphate ABC transporter permease subunit PstC, partial [Bauldia sp.]|nr:phosphate ABC transporter permease subunit PstC [Bauldia sp.]